MLTLPCLQVLLVWGAHINLQLVTQTAWSNYLLKYTLKVRRFCHRLFRPC